MAYIYSSPDSFFLFVSWACETSTIYFCFMASVHTRLEPGIWPRILTPHDTCIPFTGAVALKNIHPSTNHHFVNTEVNCTGLEANITDCIQDLDEAYSCLLFGIASISCYGKFTSRAFPPL